MGRLIEAHEIESDSTQSWLNPKRFMEWLNQINVVMGRLTDTHEGVELDPT